MECFRYFMVLFQQVMELFRLNGLYLSSLCSSSTLFGLTLKLSIMKDLPQKIRRLRELQNLSQLYLAEKLGISARTYGKIESGKINLSTLRFGQIADVLGYPPEAILAATPEEVYMQYLHKAI